MQSIIIPVDFTSRSKTALNYAALAFPGKGARFILLHSYSNSRSGEFLISIDDIIESDILKKLELEGNYLREKLSDENAEILYACERNDIVSAISNVSTKYNSDLIILGSSEELSWSDISYREEGKTMNILKSVKIPCLVVPETVSLSKPNTVLFATIINGINDSKELKPLLELLKTNNSHLDILNVGQDRFQESDLDKKLKKTTNGYFEGIDFKLHTIKDSDAYSAIGKFAANHHSDLICLMYRKHNPLERLLKQSVSKKMLTNLTKPVLTLKHIYD